MGNGHIFLSYRSTEAEFPLKLVADLKNLGFQVWMDRLEGILVGMDWRGSIERAINECSAMIAVLSPGYVESEYCRKELARANSLGKTIFPLLLNPLTPRQVPIVIEGLQWEDFTGWQDRDEYQLHFASLIHRLNDETDAYTKTVPDEETRYLTTLVSELESRRGVLEYVELHAETSSDAVRPRPIDLVEWGFEELIPQDNSEGTDDEPATISIPNLMAAFEKHPGFILIGDAGTGKTTTIRRIARDMAFRRLESPGVTSIPFIVYLPHWNDGSDLLSFIRSKFSLQCDLESSLTSGDLFLLLDGLNEMGRDSSQKIEEVGAWLKSSSAPKRFVVTCRSEDFSAHRKHFRGIPVVAISSLDADQIRDFSAHYLADQSGAFLSRVRFSDHVNPNHRSLAHLTSNPYLLSALIFLYEHSPSHELPQNNGTLFRRLAAALWSREKQRGTHNYPFEAAESRFSALAYEMIRGGMPIDVPYDYALSFIGDEEMLKAGIRANLFQYTDGGVRFYHQLMLEFFAAAHLNRIGLEHAGVSPTFGKKGRNTTAWDEVLICLCGISENSSATILELGEVDPFIAARALASGITVTTEAREKITTGLRTILSDTRRDWRMRRAAANAIGALIDDSMTADLISAVQNKHGGIRTAAALALVKRGKSVLNELPVLLKHKNWEVRLTITQVLGAIADDSVSDYLAEMLADEDFDVRREAARGLGKLQSVSAIPNLVSSLRDPHPQVRKMVGWALVRIGLVAVPALEILIDDRTPVEEQVSIGDIATGVIAQIHAQTAQGHK